MSTTWLWLLVAAGILYLVKVAIVMLPRLMARRSRHKLFDMLTTITEHPLATAFLTLVISVILVISLTRLFFKYDKDFFENIMVEAHGMVLDILVIGLFILWLNKLGEKRLENKRYQEEIDDFRHWHSEEAKYRIVGNIKRLNRNSISKINLSHCYLAKVDLISVNLEGADLLAANLERAALMGANLERASLWRATLTSASLWRANLTGAGLQMANLTGVDLKGVNLTSASLRVANLMGADLKEANLTGADLQESKNLTEEQIQSAQIDERTMLPDYLKRPT